MLQRVLEPEVMDSEAEAVDYDSMDHREVNRKFVDDFLATNPIAGEILDLGTGTAQIPIELCRRDPRFQVLAIDLAESMLRLARKNVEAAQLARQIELERIDAKHLPYPDGDSRSGRFAAVISNSIVHHIPEPFGVLGELVRVVRPGGTIFVRDLMRPADDATVQHLVETYAAGANDHQRQMFDDSLRAALSLAEIRALVERLGFQGEMVQATSDRHWTWHAVRQNAQVSR
jgi:ubiquinone/menaquinone biosynthesis C-methylase UbiE